MRRLRSGWAEIRESYWFYPSAFGVVAIAAAITTSRIDAALASPAALRWLDVATMDGAREVLATIAGSTITVAGVVFSVSMVVLTTAAAQFGPRLTRTFMEHGGTQIVLATFIATTVFALLGLGLHGGDGTRSPRLTLAVALALALASFGTLVYFIHHVSHFVRAPRVIAAVASKLEDALCRELPPRTAADDGPPAAASTPGTIACAARSGYVTRIDHAELVELAARRDLVIHLRHHAGHYVIAGDALASVHPAHRADPRVLGAVRDAVSLASERSPAQDPEFAIRQLVELAVRALSPGINDPFSAINCVDHLGSALAVVAGRGFDPEVRRGRDGAPRVVTVPYTHEHLVSAAFDQLRTAARDHVVVLVRILHVLASLGRRNPPAPLRAALRAQVDAIADMSVGRFAAERERAHLAAHVADARKDLARGSGAEAPCSEGAAGEHGR